MDKSDDGQAFLGNPDLFYRGVITKLFPSNNMGLVRTQSGREIAFSYIFVVLLGHIKSPNDLKEGQEVGYDLGWTPNGLKVTKIKTYPESLPEEGDPDLEGQGNQGQQTSS
jgi:hypothetical protein